MTAKRNSLLTTNPPTQTRGRGADAFFTEADEPAPTQAEPITDDEPTLLEAEIGKVKVTYTIRAETEDRLEDLRHDLRKRRIKTDKSKLVDAAIVFLSEQDDDTLKRLLSRD